MDAGSWRTRLVSGSSHARRLFSDCATRVVYPERNRHQRNLNHSAVHVASVALHSTDRHPSRTHAPVERMHLDTLAELRLLHMAMSAAVAVVPAVNTQIDYRWTAQRASASMHSTAASSAAASSAVPASLQHSGEERVRSQRPPVPAHSSTYVGRAVRASPAVASPDPVLQWHSTRGPAFHSARPQQPQWQRQDDERHWRRWWETSASRSAERR